MARFANAEDLWLLYAATSARQLYGAGSGARRQCAALREATISQRADGLRARARRRQHSTDPGHDDRNFSNVVRARIGRFFARGTIHWSSELGGECRRFPDLFAGRIRLQRTFAQETVGVR